MTDVTTSHQAAGYIFLADRDGVQALLFGQCEADPSNITYRATVSQPGQAPRRCRLLARGNFPASSAAASSMASASSRWR